MSMKSPSAVYICADSGVPVFGEKGCSVHVQEMLGAFLEEGLDMRLIAQRLGGVPGEQIARARLSVLPPLAAPDVAGRETSALLANRDQEAILSHCGAHRAEFLYERYSLWSYAGMEFARRVGVPGLLEVNAPLIDEQLEHRGLVHLAECREVAHRVFEAATHLLAVSEELAAWLDAQPGARGKVSVLPNGVSPSRFVPNVAPAQVRGLGGMVIGFLGTLKPWHGLMTLLEAVAVVRQQRPDAQLLLVGDGPERARLAARAEELGISSAVHFAGAVKPSDVPSWLASMDVAVAPYPPMESFYFSPLKVYEYLAAGRAIVASRIGQITSVVQDGVTGLLVEPGQVAPLSQALLRLSADAGLRQSLGCAGRSWVLQHRTWKASARKVRALAAESRNLEVSTP
jgi:glycosyltransferase involved in cell wall biosynthesis